MRVVLEVTSDSNCGKRTWLLPGQSIEVGRTQHASFALDHDELMSPVHFSLVCDADTCLLRDLNSERGTWVNGKHVRETSLRDADQIRAGETTMTVHIEGAAQEAKKEPRDAEPRNDSDAAGASFLHSVGGWRFQSIPDGWSPAPGVGLQRHDGGLGVAGCRVTEQEMPGKIMLDVIAKTLATWGESTQVVRMRHHKVNIPGAEQAFETVLRFKTPSSHSFVQTQVYAASGRTLGFATFITVDRDDRDVQVDEIISGLAFVGRDHTEQHDTLALGEQDVSSGTDPRSDYA